jgi:hypothetical protein
VAQVPSPGTGSSAIDVHVIREPHRPWRVAMATVVILLILAAVFIGGYATRMLTHEKQPQVAACRHALDLGDDAFRAAGNALVQHDPRQFTVWADVHAADWQAAKRDCRTNP